MATSDRCYLKTKPDDIATATTGHAIGTHPTKSWMRLRIGTGKTETGPVRRWMIM